MLICFALVTNSIFAACPTHTGAPPEEAPHFDLQNYATGDWFGLRNTLYDYGIEITGGYTAEPAGNPVGGIEHGFTYLHNFGFGVLFDLQKIAGIPGHDFSGNRLAKIGTGFNPEVHRQCYQRTADLRGRSDLPARSGENGTSPVR